MNSRMIVFAIVLFLSPSFFFADVIHVPSDRPTIQDGIDAASDGDTVLVADGTYTGTDNRDIDFRGKAITVKSANGPEHCIIVCLGSIWEPHRGFYFHRNEGFDSVVEGFTIRNGLKGFGGGIYCKEASPTIRNNIITLCVAYDPIVKSEDRNGVREGFRRDQKSAVGYGAGICCYWSSPTIVNNIIIKNTADNAGGGIYCMASSSPVIMNNTITENSGGGITCKNSSPTILGNTITQNTSRGISCSRSSPEIMNNTIAENSGRGIYCSSGSSPAILGNTITQNTGILGGGIECRGSSSPEIKNNFIIANHAENSVGGGYGGGIVCGYGSSPEIMNNIIAENRADDMGGGIHIYTSSPEITNNLIIANRAGDGGGISCYHATSVRITNTLIIRNRADSHQGGGIYTEESSVTVTNSILRGDWPDEIFVESPQLPVVTYCDIEGGYNGAGNIDADPLFVTGPLGDYYLSQRAAGQNEESPCVDAGDPAGEMIDGTTRTDGLQDTGIVDMGYHYPTMIRGIATGPGPAKGNPPRIRIFPPEQDAHHSNEFDAYGLQHYGVNVTAGEVDRDNKDEIITGPGPGAVFGPHVRAFEIDGTPVQGLNFIAYGTKKWGVNVAAGDIDQDGFDEIITGAGPGAVFGPHVRAFDYDGTPSVTPVQGVSYIAYNTRQWGVNVTSGDIDGDGFDEIMTGPGPGIIFGPHVRGWDVDGGQAEPMQVSYFAYSLRGYGVVVGCGDVDGDGFDEIMTAPGPGKDFFAHVRGWDYDNVSISPLPGCHFIAWQPTEASYGGRVFAGTDLNRDGSDEIIVGVGPDPYPYVGPQVKVYGYEGSSVTERFSLVAFPSSWTHGVNVAAGRF